MEAPFTVYPNVRGAAKDIHSAITAPHSKRFTMRPWNQYRPENTLWWLVPSTQWPACAFGKAVIFREPDNRFFYGLVVEKGLDPRIRELYGSKKGQGLIMDGSWCWYRFLEGLEDDRIFKAVQTIHAATALPVKLEIQSGIVDDPSLFDPYSERDPGDKIIWEYEAEKFSLVAQPSRYLSPLADIHDIQGMKRVLSGIEELDWLWVDFYLGVSIPNYQQVPPEEVNKKAWDGYLLWEKIIEPLNPWIL